MTEAKPIKHRNKDGRVWFHLRESGEGFPRGTWIWNEKGVKRP